jgi:osmotically-inducible protein OsmY
MKPLTYTSPGPLFSPSQLVDAAAASLHQSGYAALAFVACHVQGDAIVLDGSVPTYHLKQLAQAIVRRVDGVRRIDNRLEVRRPGESPRALR